MDHRCHSRRSIALAAIAASAFLLLMPLASSNSNARTAFAQSSTMSVSLDKKTYKMGDTITVTGKAPTKDSIFIKVFNPNGDLYRVDAIVPHSDGSYSYKLKVGGKLAINGEFKVTVAYLSSSADAKFTLTGGAEPGKKPASSATAAAGMFKVTAKQSKKDTKITVQVDKKSKGKVSKVVFEADVSLGKLKVRAPSGWKADVSDKTVTFTASDKKVIKPGKKATFTLPVVPKTASWSTYDGSVQLDRGTLAIGKK